jgi:hypothetical protein
MEIFGYTKVQIRKDLVAQFPNIEDYVSLHNQNSEKSKIKNSKIKKQKIALLSQTVHCTILLPDKFYEVIGKLGNDFNK